MNADGEGAVCLQGASHLADGARGELQRGDESGGVIEVGPAADAARAHFHHLAGAVADEVHHVAPAGDEGAPGKLAPADPFVAGEGGLDAVPEIALSVDDLTDGALVEERADRLHHGVPAEDEADDAEHAGLAHAFPETAYLVQMDPHRFLQDDVLAGARGLGGQPGVQIVWHADGDGIHAVIAQQRLVVGVEGAL